MGDVSRNPGCFASNRSTFFSARPSPQVEAETPLGAVGCAAVQTPARVAMWTLIALALPAPEDGHCPCFPSSPTHGGGLPEGLLGAVPKFYPPQALELSEASVQAQRCPSAQVSLIWPGLQELFVSCRPEPRGSPISPCPACEQGSRAHFWLTCWGAAKACS